MDLNQIPNRYHNFRKYKFVFKMAFQFNEQHFGEPIPLNIGKALLENNSLKHGLFEVLASALDGEAGARPHIEFDEATNTVTIMNEGHVIKPEHFRVGSGRNPRSIHGQHGFGMKDYIATFIRFGCEVGIKSGRLNYSFELNKWPSWRSGVLNRVAA